MRSDLWYRLSNADESKKETMKNYYSKLLEMAPDSESEEIIEKDLFRTFPDNYYFQNKKFGFIDSMKVKFFVLFLFLYFLVYC